MLKSKHFPFRGLRGCNRNLRTHSVFLLILFILPLIAKGQCLSSVNPVGGTESLLVLEKKSLRAITFYKYGQATRYYQYDKPSDFSSIEKAYYNYASIMLGYGLTKRITLEAETGYYINKSQDYSQTDYTLTGRGFNNLVLLTKLNLYTNNVKRIYFSLAAGPKIPLSREMKEVDYVQLPIELQTGTGAYGMATSASLVKENSALGLRYFFTNRVEINGRNIEDYKLGTAVFTSVYISKHLMAPWIKGDWTTILQLRNETRGKDKRGDIIKEMTGGTVLFLVPQINYVAFGSLDISLMVDIPVYQYFNGTQLSAGTAFTLSLSHIFKT